MIYDGETFQIEKNIKEDKLSEEMIKIIDFIKVSLQVTNISGSLINI